MDKDEQEALYRIDERTEQIQKDLARIEKHQQKHDKEIDKLKAKTQKNTNSIKAGRAFLGAAGTAILGAWAKLIGILPL